MVSSAISILETETAVAREKREPLNVIYFSASRSFTITPITATTPSLSVFNNKDSHEHSDACCSRPLKRESDVTHKISGQETFNISSKSIVEAPKNSRIGYLVSTGLPKIASPTSSNCTLSAAIKVSKSESFLSKPVAENNKNTTVRSFSFSNDLQFEDQNQITEYKNYAPSKLDLPSSIALFASSFNSLVLQPDFFLSSVSPLQNIHEFNVPPNLKENLLGDLHKYEDNVWQYSLLEPLSQSSTNFSSLKLRCSEIFEIPEILIMILFYVGHDDKEKIPRENLPIRRSHPCSTVCYSQLFKNTPNLYNCLLVNKFWYQLTLDVLEEHLYFDCASKLVNYYKNKLTQHSKGLGSYITKQSCTKSLVLHKLNFQVKQHHLDLIAGTINPLYLTWIELYICPSLVPTPSLLTSSLQKLIIPGAKRISDNFLEQVSFSCPNLKQLDIRACEMVSDAGIFAIGLRCPQLEFLNCGRRQRGELISDVGISCIIQNTNISTLGVSGCGITNACIWEIAVFKGKTLQRLSLNNCWRLNDHGLPEVLREDYFHRLSVLEIRGCLGIKNFRPMVEFKKRQYARKITVLLETCQELDFRLAQAQSEADREITARIFSDISEWLDQRDSDCDFRELLLPRDNMTDTDSTYENNEINHGNISPAFE